MFDFSYFRVVIIIYGGLLISVRIVLWKLIGYRILDDVWIFIVRFCFVIFSNMDKVYYIF